MPYRYVWKHYKVDGGGNCDSLAEAVGRAAADLETGDAWPGRIEKDGGVLWEQSGPLCTETSLRQFADDNDIEL